MRFLVISDIHSNATALAAALAAAEGRWEQAFAWVTWSATGRTRMKSVDRVRGLVTAIIRGNHDKAASGIGDPTI